MPRVPKIFSPNLWTIGLLFLDRNEKSFGKETYCESVFLIHLNPSKYGCIDLKVSTLKPG